MKVTIWLVRHGQTEWNIQNRIQGHTDIPLNAQGLEQAKALASAIALEHNKAPFHAIHTSDLKRAQMTAETIASTLNLTAQVHPHLRERCGGILEGLIKKEADQIYPHLLQNLYTDTVNVLPGVEPFFAMKERLTKALQEIVKKHAGERIIVVTHGSALCGLYESFTGKPHKQDQQFKKPENAEICVVSFDKGEWNIEAWAKNISSQKI